MNKLYVLLGESGTGKDYVIDKIISNNNKYSRVLSATNRPKRYKNENTHRFVTDEEMKKEINNKIAGGKHGKYYYYTLVSDLKPNSFLTLSPQGLDMLLKNNEVLSKYDIKIFRLYRNKVHRLFNMIILRKDGIKKSIKRIVEDDKKYKYCNYKKIKPSALLKNIYKNRKIGE